MEEEKMKIGKKRSIYFNLNCVKDFYIVAHRGACAYEIENTIPAFQKAMEMGANALETDISFTKDNVPVIWHDFNPDDPVAIGRQMGLESGKFGIPSVPDFEDENRKPVPELTLNMLREFCGFKKRGEHEKTPTKIPTVEELMIWAEDQSQLKLIFFDMKVTEDYLHLIPKMMGEIKKLIDQYHPHYRIVFMTPREKALVEMKKIYPDLDYTFDVELPPGILFDEQDYSSINIARKFGNTFSSIGLSVIGQLFPWGTYERIIKYDSKQKGDIKLFAWTINSEFKFRCLINLGMDGIITDVPDKLSNMSKKILCI
jgi:glycerophosphoryl diester phosphodiesterase